MSTARHAMTKRVGGRFTMRAAIVAVIVGALLLAAVPVVGRYFSMRSQLTSTGLQMATLQHEIQQLDAKIRRYHDPSYIEQLARQCLGMVKPGEVPFVIVPKHGAPKPPPC